MRGSLDIEVLNRATGLKYKLDKIFYGLFPVYALESCPGTVQLPVSLVDLTYDSVSKNRRGRFRDRETLIHRVTDLVNNGKFDLANQLTNGSLSELLEDWEALNR